MQHAIKRLIVRLKTVKHVPTNGLVMLGGYYCDGKEDVSAVTNGGASMTDGLTFFEPPQPITRLKYLCDKKFHLDDIIPMYAVKDVVKDVILLVRGTDATLYSYISEINMIKEIGSTSGNVRKKHCRGGQSQNRFQRLRDEDVKSMVDKICNLLKENCLDASGSMTLRCLVITGPGERKKQVHDCLAKNLDLSGINILLLSSDGSAKGSLDAAASVIDETVYHALLKTAGQEVDELIRTAPDALVFGEKHVMESAREFVLKRVYCSNNHAKYKEISEVLDGSTTEVITLPPRCFIEKYEGLIGVKWFSS